MARKRVAITISLPPDVAESYEKVARQEAKNRSELFRDMFLIYQRQTLEREYFDLQRYGFKLAKKKGILTEKDVERIVFEDH